MAETVKKASSKPKAPAKPRKTAATANGVPSNVTQMKAPREHVAHDQVAQLAHRYWAERGHQHGHHEEDWYRAEQELRGKAS
jgi:Protein of unknown function (DUF2934)